MGEIEHLILLYDEMQGLSNYLNNHCDNETPEFIEHINNRLFDVENEFTVLLSKVKNMVNTVSERDNKMILNVKYTKDVPEIKTIKGGDWIDLSTAEDVHMQLFDTLMIPLGVCIQLPKGYEAILVPRSSTFNKWGIMMNNSIGVIDESYCGNNDEWHFPAICMRSETFIPKGTRICQFRIFKHQPPIGFTNVEFMTNENRGGFGSTG